MWWLPNLLTGFRIALTPVVIFHILKGDCAPALLWTAIAGGTDGVDGFVARRFGSVTRSGAYLDPIADKLLLTSVYVALGVRDLVPVPLVWLVIGRDIVILLMVAAGFLFTAIREFPPTLWGKLSTIVQVGAAVIFLAACSSILAAQALQNVTVYAVAITTAWSGLHYVWTALCKWKQRPRP